MKFKSPIISAASGSIAGATFSRNRGGMYMRARSIPVNTQTTRRDAIRAAFAAASNDWRFALTAAQRGDWTSYAEASPMTDQFGDEKILTGQQMFMRSAVLRLQMGLAIVANAPSVPGFGRPVDNFSTAEINIGGSDFLIAGDFGGEIPDDGDVHISIGAMMSTGQNYYRGPFQLVIAAAVAATDTGFSEAAVSYPPLGLSDRTPTEDDRYAFRGVVVYDDGRVSEPIINIKTITQGV